MTSSTASLTQHQGQTFVLPALALDQLALCDLLTSAAPVQDDTASGNESAAGVGGACIMTSNSGRARSSPLSAGTLLLLSAPPCS